MFDLPDKSQRLVLIRPPRKASFTALMSARSPHLAGMARPKARELIRNQVGTTIGQTDDSLRPCCCPFKLHLREANYMYCHVQAKKEADGSGAELVGSPVPDMQHRAAALFSASEWRELVALCAKLAKLAPDALVFGQSAHAYQALGQMERAVR